MSIPARQSVVPTARELFLTPRPADEEALEAQARAFFHSIALRNGTHKTTFAHRLDDLNAVVNTLLPAHRPLEVMDVAVSSGISTLEWMESLQAAGVECRMLAGDLTVHAFLLSMNRSLHILVDRTGYPLQFDILGRPIPYPPGKRRFWLFPLLLAVRAVLPSLFAAVCKGHPSGKADGTLSRFGIRCRPITLVSPRLGECADIQVIEDDILSNTALPDRFHVLRAANILNRSYFSEEKLQRILTNLRARLKQDGLLIVCRTSAQNVNHGTIFRRNEDGKFAVVRRIGDGSEIENLVLALPAPVGTDAS